MGMETGIESLPEHSELLRRSWQDLETWRLGIALAVAPILPILLGGVLSAFNAGRFAVGPWAPPLPFIVMAAAAELWSALFGIFYLMTSPRRSGAMTRGNCLFVGGLAAVLFPPALILLLLAAMDATSLTLATMALAFSTLLGLFLTPLGVLGGWIFWLIGVQPAKLAASDDERVFE
jgi:hypothetical protein